MTHKEMTEIFAAMKLAYPNAKMFSGGIDTLRPTIELWTSCLPDVDFWTGQQALLRMCRVAEFPSIAAFREQADKVKADVRRMLSEAESTLRDLTWLCGSSEEVYAGLAPGPIRQAIDAIGGVGNLTDSTGTMWQWESFEAAYIAIIKKTKQISGSPVMALPDRREKI